MQRSRLVALLLTLVPSTLAQGFGGGFGGSGGGNPYSGGGNGNGNGNGNGFGGFDPDFFLSRYHKMIIAHAVLATLAFGFFFPVGGIMIRLASFRGLWLVHGLFQLFAALLYIAAFGIGVYMAHDLNLMDHAHPIIGIILLILIVFQPFLGFIHHFAFKKYSRRVVWSHGHIWLGRIIITLGIINGGLGLQLAQQFPISPPTTGDIVAYSVVAGVIWLLYVISAMVGERRRGQVLQTARPGQKEANGNTAQYA